ncbi:acyl-CoA dehydrogenase family protein [Pseudovibrio exalbescens]|uniref:acyl-CoA dehydrogenase family protein n=1 Tax=Pseudovibrio exalbescens TaxID=197461 RepID=UPI002366C9F2|nr:acyl-CoA dehydrogenase family protein [Pseudovibrio exalbescens]MDD7911187.1 acyl-CoA dehydrogenase family protein [Pseudovibrio exalbescens]
MYRAPVNEIAFTLREVTGLKQLQGMPGNEELTDDLVDAILSEAAKFAEEEIAPLNRKGDLDGAKLVDGWVKTTPGWKECYTNWYQGGWNSLTGSPEFGGQGLPNMLHVAVMEMWNSGSMAFTLGPTLTIGAVEAIETHGSDYLKSTYLPKLISGEWTGTMNLTEPQAGSDLSALRSRAEPQGDGTYKIFGQKIYITYGDHDMTDNIVHLVLARLPDAPAGTRGISLFVVPKYMVNEDGSLGELNDVRVAGVEHKLGIHGSPTCTMVYGDEGGAIGYLVGEENRGLACMFTMMNNARLAVGVQGLGIAELAFQEALAYALERRQGKAPGSTEEGMSPIAELPDVKRMLLSMKSKAQVARAICFACAHALDMAKAATDPEQKKFWSERAGLLTPIAKGYSTDIGVDVASIGIQVHGGMGFVEETGAAQHLRDARIAPIYEGTNGIQAMDLVMRKLPLSGGEHLKAFVAELREVEAAVSAENTSDLGHTARKLKSAIDDFEAAAFWLLEAQGAGKTGEALAGATPFLKLAGLTLGGAMLAKGAIASKGEDELAHKRRVQLARAFAETELGETAGLKEAVIESGEGVLSVNMAEFA